MTHDHAALSVGIDAVIPAGMRHGSGCVIGHRAVIGDGCVLGDRVQIGASATVLPAMSPNDALSSLWIRDGVSIGAAAVVCGPSTIGIGARVEPGSVVTHDVPPHAIVSGNPAQVVGYSSPPGIDLAQHAATPVSVPDDVGVVELIGGASLVRLPEVVDLRGRLTFAEVGGLLPFVARRFFFVYDVPNDSIRGEHAHRTLHEFLICAASSVRVSLTDGRERCEVTLSEPTVGLHLPPGIWSTQYRYEPPAVLLVLCSDEYDPASYIRDFDEYTAEIE